MLASDAGVVEKDKVAELELTAVMLTAVITVSVGGVPVPLVPPELPPQAKSTAHNNVVLIIVSVRVIRISYRAIGTCVRFRAPTASETLAPVGEVVGCRSSYSAGNTNA